jgi:Skp family chaperone for outer membrane proteins
MKIRYYSEVLNKYFDEEKDLLNAEKEYKKVQENIRKEQEEARAKMKILVDTRKERAKEVEDAFKNANQLMEEFTRDYGSFHFTMTTPFTSIVGLFDEIFNF